MSAEDTREVTIDNTGAACARLVRALVLTGGRVDRCFTLAPEAMRVGGQRVSIFLLVTVPLGRFPEFERLADPVSVKNATHAAPQTPRTR